jgi:hypothetical protein
LPFGEPILYYTTGTLPTPLFGAREETLPPTSLYALSRLPQIFFLKKLVTSTQIVQGGNQIMTENECLFKNSGLGLVKMT